MFKNIMIPFDGSEEARRGAQHAMNLADKYGANLHTLFVIDQRIYGETPALSTHELIFEELADYGEELLEELQRKGDDHGLKIHSSVKRGIPHEQIVQYAREHEIDLIVMGRQGRAGHSESVLGSTSDRVLRMTNIPVLQI